MIICLCHNVSDRTIKEMMGQGYMDLKAMQKQCAIARSCGKCAVVVKKMIGAKSGLSCLARCANSPIQNNFGDIHGQRCGKEGNYSFIK